MVGQADAERTLMGSTAKAPAPQNLIDRTMLRKMIASGKSIPSKVCVR
jgi:hypothetical protein